jgi:hypothetical protein
MSFEDFEEFNNSGHMSVLMTGVSDRSRPRLTRWAYGVGCVAYMCLQVLSAESDITQYLHTCACKY